MLIETRGVILDSEEHKLLTLQFYNEIIKYNTGKIIIDVSKTTFPKSLEFHSYIVGFYKEELPEEINYGESQLSIQVITESWENTGSTKQIIMDTTTLKCSILSPKLSYL